MLNISLLCESKALPQEANDHALKGTWLGFREFH
ncbi:type II toxin-antitoxin system YafQ family toxin, partial [Helicobacter rodentium]